MKIQAVVALAAAALFASGCATHRHGHHHAPSQNPDVVVDGGRAKISPELLLFRSAPGSRPIDITWRLDPKGSFRFAARGGVVVEGEITDQMIRGDRPSVVLDPKQDVIVNCRVAEDRLTATCTNTLARPGVFKYTIRVSDGKQDIAHDPMIANW